MPCHTALPYRPALPLHDTHKGCHYISPFPAASPLCIPISQQRPRRMHGVGNGEIPNVVTPLVGVMEG